MATDDRRLLVVTRRTRLERLLAAYGTKGQAQFYLKQARMKLGFGAEEAEESFADLRHEQETYQRSLATVRAELEGLLPMQVVDRELLPSLVLGPNDIVVAVGQDGLVANVAKYALSRPIIGVNPDTERFDGVLLPFLPEELRGTVQRVLAGQAPLESVTLAEARLQDGQRLLAFNDLFIGVRSHASARYTLSAGIRSEAQSSSGIIVATGAGSTGWLSSVLNMVQGVSNAFGQPTPPKPSTSRLKRSDRHLAWVVREPFVSRASSARLVAGWIEPGEALTVESAMEEGGVIFSDGMQSDGIDFRAGRIASLRAATEQALLVQRAP